VPALLAADELTAIIEQPARAVGLSWAPGLGDRIARDAAALAALHSRRCMAAEGPGAVVPLPR
jgi:hypothetical protein